MITKLLVFCICAQIATALPLSAAPLIMDEFAEETLNPTPIEQFDNSKVKIEDEFAKKYTPKNSIIPLSVKKDRVIDEIALKLDKKKIKPAKVKTTYNYSIAPIPVQLKITQNLTTKNDGVKEGDLILFKTIKSTNLGKYFLPKDSETVSSESIINSSALSSFSSISKPNAPIIYLPTLESSISSREILSSNLVSGFSSGKLSI